MQSSTTLGQVFLQSWPIRFADFVGPERQVHLILENDRNQAQLTFNERQVQKKLAVRVLTPPNGMTISTTRCTF